MCKCPTKLSHASDNRTEAGAVIVSHEREGVFCLSVVVDHAMMDVECDVYAKSA